MRAKCNAISEASANAAFGCRLLHVRDQPMRLIPMLMILSLFAHSNAMAQEALSDCHKNQLTENICASEKAEIADKKLNRVYQEQYNRLNEKNDKARFQASQRAWLKYRDTSCLYEARGSREEGGSKFPMEYSMCLEKITKQRIGEIESYLRCNYNGCPE
jgi:uncharacterized protein YecT (DUF1311 family)